MEVKHVKIEGVGQVFVAWDSIKNTDGTLFLSRTVLHTSFQDLDPITAKTTPQPPPALHPLQLQWQYKDVQYICSSTQIMFKMHLKFYIR
jgi:hypothetical protein